MTSSRRPGFVYILTSTSCASVKIGGTDRIPFRRIKEINESEPYRSVGPWTLYDCLHVSDWPTVEGNLHYTFRSQRDTAIRGQKELFSVDRSLASEHLQGVDENLIVKRDKVERLFFEESFAQYLADLFKASTLPNWLDYQGAWTLNLFNGTVGGRYFTLNIGTHEVAFTSLAKRDRPRLHMVFVDSSVRDYRDVMRWLTEHDGDIKTDNYKSAMEHSASVSFQAEFSEAREFLQLAGVRRAIIAYWTDALVRMQERNTRSVSERYHNYNVVSEIIRRIKRGTL